MRYLLFFKTIIQIMLEVRRYTNEVATTPRTTTKATDTLSPSLRHAQGASKREHFPTCGHPLVQRTRLAFSSFLFLGPAYLHLDLHLRVVLPRIHPSLKLIFIMHRFRIPHATSSKEEDFLKTVLPQGRLRLNHSPPLSYLLLLGWRRRRRNNESGKNESEGSKK